jgi:hypothetical protein
MDILDYVLAHEAGNVQRVGNGYRLKDHDSLWISSGRWYWHSRNVGGNAVDFLTIVRGFSFTDAVEHLAGSSRQYDYTTKTTVLPERKKLALPVRHQDNRRVTAYLRSRGIDREIIKECIERGVLYESRVYHNCVFLGRDERGKARYAAQRGTASSLKIDAEGSDKRYGFTLPPADPTSKEISIFESPIDALSHATLCKQGFIPPFDGWRLALGGTSILALTHFLEHHPEVARCIVCTDNDEAGEIAATKIAEIPCVDCARAPPSLGNDWNEALQLMQQAERKLDRAQTKESTLM